MTSTRMDGPPHRRQRSCTQDRLESIHLQTPIESLLYELARPPGHREIPLRVREGLLHAQDELLIRRSNVPVDPGAEPGHRPGCEFEHDEGRPDGHAIHDLYERADSSSDGHDAEG